MTPRAFATEVFGIGTGWLGWAPGVVLTTPIPQILIAWRAKVDMLERTNPWGTTPKAGKAQASEAVGDRAAIAAKVAGTLRTLGGNPAARKG